MSATACTLATILMVEAAASTPATEECPLTDNRCKAGGGHAAVRWVPGMMETPPEDDPRNWFKSNSVDGPAIITAIIGDSWGLYDREPDAPFEAAALYSPC